MNARIFYALVPVAVLLSASASAQRAPTQRPLELTLDKKTNTYRTVVRENAVPQTRPGMRRQIVKQTIRRPSANVVHTTTQRVVTRPVPVVAATERVVTRSVPVVRQRIIAPQPTTTFVTADPLDLSQDQRTIVYRTLAQPALQPVPVIDNRVVSPHPYVLNERVVTTAPVGQRVISTIDPTFGERVLTTAPQTTGVGTVIANDPLMRTPGAFGEFDVGTRLPASVPVYAMPASLAARAPSIGGYYYARIDDRVYLVDPRDGIVVGMLYQ